MILIMTITCMYVYIYIYIYILILVSSVAPTPRGCRRPAERHARPGAEQAEAEVGYIYIHI